MHVAQQLLRFALHLLLMLQVDLIEPSEHLLSQAKTNLRWPGHKCVPSCAWLNTM